MVENIKSYLKRHKKAIIVVCVVSALIVPWIYTFATAKSYDRLAALGQEWEAALEDFILEGGNPLDFITKESFINGVENGEIIVW